MGGVQPFSSIPFLAPEGFSGIVGFPTEPLIPAPAAWGNEVGVLRLKSIPSLQEHVVVHRRSSMLIVADLPFTFGADVLAGSRFLGLCAVGARHQPGLSRPFRLVTKDAAALQGSLRALRGWDFEWVIVGRGDVIETGTSGGGRGRWKPQAFEGERAESGSNGYPLVSNDTRLIGAGFQLLQVGAG
jgi:hypothetical protein